MSIQLHSVLGPYSTSDRNYIDAILASSNEYDRGLLALNSNITAEDIEILSKDNQEQVRLTIAGRKSTPTHVLKQLQTDSSDTVRATAFSNSKSDFIDFKNAVLNQKFSALALSTFCISPHVAAELEMFKHLWNTKKRDRDGLIWGLLKAIDNNHTVDPNIQSFLDAEILTQSNKLRERYAQNPLISNPEILDQMKTDPCRKVISYIASNSAACSSTHEYIFLNHKSSSTRMDIARVTKDSELLNLIHGSTKGKQLLAEVEKNPHFTPYI